MSRKVLALRPIELAKEELEELRKYAQVDFLHHEPTREEMIASLKAQVAQHGPYEVLIVLFGVSAFNPMNEEFLGCLVPGLRMIASAGAGYSDYDQDWLQSQGVMLANTPNAVTESTATFASLLVLATLRGLSEAEQSCRRGDWRSGLAMRRDPEGLLLGIVGMGRIGKAIARQMQVFGMRIQYSNRRPLDKAEEAQVGAKYVDMDTLLGTSDVIVVQCPLTPETYHLINADAFAKMRRGVCIVNTARGAVIHEEALADALDSGIVAFAGLDVFEHEPRINDRIRVNPRVTLHPHFAAFTERTFYVSEADSVRNTTAYLASGEPLHRAF